MIQSGTAAAPGGASSPALSLGVHLRHLRQARGLTLERAAQAAGIGRVTLNRWETGAHQPRLPELEALLGALAADARQRQQALALVNAPRARAQVKEVVEHVGERAGIGPPPGAGDLVHALRLRRRLRPEQTTAALGITTRTLRRWERGEAAVPAERLDDLCRVLGAAPQERAALAAGKIGLWIPNGSGAAAVSSPEAVEWQTKALLTEADRGEWALLDLQFLAIEARLWPQAARQTAVRGLMARVSAAHANVLERQGRRAEVKTYCERALTLWTGPVPRVSWWETLVHSVVWAGQSGLTAGSNRRRVAHIRHWLDARDDPTWHSFLYRDMAQYAADAGESALALDAVRKATALAERSGNPVYPILARHIHVHVLLAAGRPAEALPLLPEGDSHDISQRLLDLGQRARVLLALGERTEAQTCLNRADVLCREHDLPTEAPDDVARQF